MNLQEFWKVALLMWLIFTSRINLSFNSQVQRFTRLNGITKHVRDFKVFRRQRSRVFPNKNACSVSLESKRAGADSIREKLLVGFISRLCQTGFCGQRCTALPPLGTPDVVAWSAFGQFFAGAAWDVTLESSCKIAVINIGSFAVSQTAPPALSKLYHYKAQRCRRVVEKPISIPPMWTDHANGLWMSPSASRCWMAWGCKRCYFWVTAVSA